MTTIFFLLLVMTLGIVAIANWIDPNNFKGFISQTIKEKTGYELTIDGDLRWRIWPKMSIITDGVKLQAQDAQKPLLTADNMRLDVELLPLLVKKLDVKNVFVKSAVITLSKDSKTHKKGETNSITINNQNVPASSPGKSNNWAFSINKLQFVDSVVVLQKGDDAINFRDINLLVTEKASQKLNLVMTGHVNRNLRDLIYSVNADVDFTDNFETITTQFNQFNYRYLGADLPEKGIEGSVIGSVIYDKKLQQVQTKQLVLNIEENRFTADLVAILGKLPFYSIRLSADQVNLSSFLSNEEKTNTNVVDTKNVQRVTVNQTPSKNSLAFLRDFDADIAIDIANVMVNKLTFTDLAVKATNENGVLDVQKIVMGWADGQVDLTAAANGYDEKTKVALSGYVKQLNLEKVYQQLLLKDADLQGRFGVDGHFVLDSLESKQMMKHVSGQAKLTLDDVKFNKLNLDELLQTNIERVSKEKVSISNVSQYTQFKSLQADSLIKNGVVELASLTANSDTLDVTGYGVVDIPNYTTDLNLNVLLKNWQSNNDIVKQLRTTPIPLRIYGDIAELHYQLDLDALLKQVLTDKGKTGLNQYLEKLKEAAQDEDFQKKAKEKIKDFLKKLN